jgi:UDP-GlcNAc:undecaprenyl-phosphate GlcNAc-1-phosphate transferase
MADGLDGLSGGLVLIALGFIAIVAAVSGTMPLLGLVGILACSVAAFLTMNFRLLWKKSALVYLGDAGSTLLGFILAYLLIQSSQGTDPVFAPVFALWFLAIPLMDAVYLLVARPLRKISPFTPGVDHLHHNLMKRGLDVKTTVLLLYAAALTFGVIGLIGFLLETSEGFMFLAFLALFCFYTYVGQVLGRCPSRKSATNA